MMKNTNKILTVLIPILIFSCGFKPLKQKSNNQIFLQNVNIVGEQKVAYLLKNNILLISDKNSPNIYDVSIKLIKQKNSKIKDTTGSTTRYTLKLSASLELTGLDSKDKIQKVFVRSADYNVANIHSDTINNENSASKNITQQLSDDITNFIILRMRNK